MKTLYIFIFFLLLLGCKQNRDIQEKNDFQSKIQHLVLVENNPQVDYLFKINFKDNLVEYNVTYLGSLKSSKGNLKILNSSICTGLYEDSKRSSGAVFLYNDDNQYIGMYQVGGASSLPSKIQSDSLVFDYNNEDCDCITKIGFKDSIPKSIFIWCDKGMGDFYTLTTDSALN